MKMWLYPLWVIINILVALSTLSLWIAAPEYVALNIGLTVFTVSLAILLCFLRWKEIGLFVRSQYFKHVLYHGLNLILVICILGVINYLGNKNYTEFDLSREQRNSLTDQTKKILSLVKTPLTLTIFAKREEWKPMIDVLKLYEAQNKWIKISAIDTDVRPDLVKEKNITQNGTVLMSFNGRESRFQIGDELAITNAILKIVKEEKIILYLVTGHEELSCEQTSQEGISDLCRKLKEQNYEIRTLDLAKTERIPRDASGLLILGPISGFFNAEAKQVEDYLNQGGSLFLALAPAFKSEVYENLTRLAKPFGLKLGKDVVIDRLSTVQGAEATIPIITKYEENHPITSSFNQRTVFPLSSSVSTLEGNDAAVILASTSPFPGSWAETDLKGITTGKAHYQEGFDQKGPIGLMGVGERVGAGASKDSRFILLGSSSFLINAYQNQSGNTTLFLNSISWLVKDEGIISFNRPGLEEYPVILSARHIQMIFVIAILIVPIVFFGAGIFIYRRRRLL
jgi:ABC-type uncharacterized transport system involved in gliding motility auxiliary subunit